MGTMTMMMELPLGPDSSRNADCFCFKLHVHAMVFQTIWERERYLKIHGLELHTSEYSKCFGLINVHSILDFLNIILSLFFSALYRFFLYPQRIREVVLTEQHQ